MIHSVSGWTQGVQVKLWDPLRTRAIPERLRGAFTKRRYTNPRLPLPLRKHFGVRTDAGLSMLVIWNLFNSWILTNVALLWLFTQTASTCSLVTSDESSSTTVT